MQNINNSNFNTNNSADNHENTLHNTATPSTVPPSFTTTQESLTAKKISAISVASSHASSMSADKIGRKGMFLATMQQIGLQVPQFSCIDIDILQQLEDISIPIAIVKQYIPSIHLTNNDITINKLKNIIYNINADTQRQVLINGFNKLLTSKQLYTIVKDTEINKQIQTIYNSINPNNDQAIIVRSSGINEDNFGDAQAGKYHSKVHGAGNVITTVLELIAVNFTADITHNNSPTIIPMVLQQVVKSKIGGVIMSYNSIKDNSIHLEFAPGQPKGAVCGQAGIIPHSCIINRTVEDLTVNYARGSITKQFILEQQGDTFAEVELPYIEQYDDHLLSAELINKTTTSIQILESLLKCPVDVEIAIDENNSLHILQVRPITRLSGATTFNIAVPNNQICSGELISEGVVTGTTFVVNNDDDLTKVPEGAIIIADHATDAMLTTNFLNKVSGFIFKNCGVNDHVAITLRQAEKPCLLFSEKDFAILNSYQQQQVTIAAGSFNQNLTAYLLAGNQVATLEKQLVTSNNVSDILNYPQSALQKVPDFATVDVGFQLLHQQNSKLLDFYQMQGVFNQCLSEKNLILISMSLNRDQIIQKLIAETQSFKHELAVLLDILEHYIQLGISSTTPNDIKDKLNAYQQEIIILQEKLSILTTQVNFLTDIINIFADSDFKLGNFNKWLQDCKLLSDKLQNLYAPHTANQVDSLHDLIFLVHKIFIEATNYVAIGSGQGNISEETNQLDGTITWINFANDSIFSTILKTKLKSMLNKSTVILMQNIAIANCKLGMNHFCTIEMLENADGGKGRALRFNFADEFSYSFNKNGKFNRVIILKILLNKYIANELLHNINICVAEQTGSVMFEYTHIQSQQMLEETFSQVIEILGIMRNLDLKLNSFKFNAKMDFKQLENILITTDLDRDELFFYRFLIKCAEANIIDQIDCLNDEERQILTIYRSFIENPKTIKNIAQKDNLTTVEQKALFHFLFSQPHLLFSSWYNGSWQINKKLIEYELSINGENLEYLPEQYKKDKYFVLIAISSNMEAIQFADESLLDDETFMNPLIKQDYGNLVYTSERLQNKPEFVLPALKQNGYVLKYLSDNIKDNKECFLVALNAPFIPFSKKEKSAYEFGSERLKNDPDIIAIKNSTNELS